jgi:hypothetical protein
MVGPFWSAQRSSAGRAQGSVQDGHELGNTALASGGEGIPIKNIHQDRCGAFSSPLDEFDSDVGIVACVQLGYARHTCSSTENVAYLGSFRDGVEVCGSCGIAGGACSETCSFGGRFLCCPVCVQRGDALQLGPSRVVYELLSGINGCPRSRITGVGVLEYREDFLSALCHVARHNSELIHGQLEVSTRSNRHDSESPIDDPPEYPTTSGRRQTLGTQCRRSSQADPWVLADMLGLSLNERQSRWDFLTDCNLDSVHILTGCTPWCA